MSTRFCYVVMAHTDPEGALRLIRRITTLSPEAVVVLRYDDPDYVDSAAVRAAGAIPLLSRVRVSWGDWSLVDMMLEALTFVRTSTDADHAVLVSGQDYPVRDLAEWEREVRSWGCDAVLDPHPTHRSDWAYRWSIRRVLATGAAAVDRLTRYAVSRVGDVLAPVAPMHLSGRPGDDRLWVGLRRPAARREPIPVTKCSQWMTLNAAAIDSVLTRDRLDRATRRYFEHTKLPDECYVQSLVHDDPLLRVVHSDTSAKHFEDPSPNPTWVDEERLGHLLSRSGAPFVRKVPPQVDGAVLRRADAAAQRMPWQVHADVRLTGRQVDVSGWSERIRARIVSTGVPRLV